jgi:hypothetical protein
MNKTNTQREAAEEMRKIAKEMRRDFKNWDENIKAKMQPVAIQDLDYWEIRVLEAAELLDGHHERVQIDDPEHQLDKLDAKDVLAFCNSMNDKLLNYHDIQVFVNKTAITDDKETETMCNVTIEYSIFAKSRVKTDYDYQNGNQARTWKNYRAKKFGCSSISDENRPLPVKWTGYRGTPGDTCACGHKWEMHNRFMGEGNDFGCVECNCTSFKEATK